MGDLGPTDPEPHSGYTLNDIVEAANAKSIQIFSIAASEDVTYAPYTLPISESFRDLAEGTGGMMFSATADPNQVIDAIIESIELISSVGPMIYVEQDSILGSWDPFSLSWDPGSHNISADPNFAGIDNFHILPISPCVDAGDPEAVIPAESKDIDGEQRLFESIVDIGADEVVKNIADFNIDGIVDILDLNTFTAQWLTAGDEQTDLFDDDFIDLADYTIFTEQWLWKGAWNQE